MRQHVVLDLPPQAGTMRHFVIEVALVPVHLNDLAIDMSEGLALPWYLVTVNWA